ncbi:hypothetical protein [Haliea sp. E17]|uniref:hypothetical protein n=1 Tax=Haliea sp. E17 TaxID=3401576 RepID=UPI003AAD4F6B
MLTLRTWPVLWVTAVLAVGFHAPRVVAAEDGSGDIVYLNSATRALRGGDAREALDILEHTTAAPEAGESMARHHGIACRAWLEEDRPEKARPHCEQAIANASARSRWRYFNNLGVAAFRLGDDAAAREAFNNAAILAGVVVTPRKNLELLGQGEVAAENREAVGASLVIR